MVEEQEQWKHGGDCSVCRRAAYCHSKCRARKEKSERELQATVGTAFVKAYEKLVAPNLHKYL